MALLARSMAFSGCLRTGPSVTHQTESPVPSSRSGGLPSTGSSTGSSRPQKHIGQSYSSSSVLQAKHLPLLTGLQQRERDRVLNERAGIWISGATARSSDNVILYNSGGTFLVVQQGRKCCSKCCPETRLQWRTRCRQLDSRGPLLYQKNLHSRPDLHSQAVVMVDRNDIACGTNSSESDSSTGGEHLGNTKDKIGSNPTAWIGRGQFREERALNRRIVEAPDADYVLAVVTEALRKPSWGKVRRPPLSPLNCATALHRIAKQMDAASMMKTQRLAFARRREMKEFLPAVVNSLPECSAQGLSNIAWALSKIGGNALFFEEMDLLAQSALEKLSEFNPQNLANTAGAFASMQHASPLLFSRLGERASTVANDFRPQELVQILWAFASLNYPIDPLFDTLDCLALQNAQGSIFQNFSQQQLASMAWSTAILQQVDHLWFRFLWETVNACAISWGSEINNSKSQPKGAQHLSQLYQANLCLRLEYADLNLATWNDLEEILTDAWEKEKAGTKLSSVHHKEVDRLLVGTGGNWISEYTGAEYSLDLALVDKKVALEIDGPTHFARNTDSLLGHTVLKRRLLSAARWTIIPLPYQEWEELRGEREQMHYLRRILEGYI